jgi:hypothetical protein
MSLHLEMLGILLAGAICLDNGLARTPPMGWLSWEQFHCQNGAVNEYLFMQMIEFMEKSGYLAAGYNYFCIDDCWMGSDRDINGELYADPERFPHGMPALVNFTHKHGMKLGLLLNYGKRTCAGYTGSMGYLKKDAQTFAKWGVDMVKLDACHSDKIDWADAFREFSIFLNSTHRPILYSMEWPWLDQAMDFGVLMPTGNLWRVMTDITGNWPSLKATIDGLGDHPQWADYSGPGGWNDPDSIVVGMSPNKWTTGINMAESRTQLSIWAISAAPFILSADLRNMTSWAKEMVLNPEVIAVDQDVLGRQGKRLTGHDDDSQIWARLMANGDWAVALYNRGDQPRDITFDFSLISETIKKMSVRDLWQRKDLGEFETRFRLTNVVPHDTWFLRCTAK